MNKYYVDTELRFGLTWTRKASGRGILKQRNQTKITNCIAALSRSANTFDIFDNPWKSTDV